MVIRKKPFASEYPQGTSAKHNIERDGLTGSLGMQRRQLRHDILKDKLAMEGVRD
jgi:hypothetical protein